MRLEHLSFAVVAGLFLFACGGAPKPEARVSSSEGAIRGAEEVGAKNVPKAALHLKLAQEQREKALAMIKDGDNEGADHMLMRAEADAELAVALSREATAKVEADKTLEQVQELKKKAAK
jgi:hypothetical protein